MRKCSCQMNRHKKLEGEDLADGSNKTGQTANGGGGRVGWNANCNPSASFGVSWWEKVAWAAIWGFGTGAVYCCSQFFLLSRCCHLSWGGCAKSPPLESPIQLFLGLLGTWNTNQSLGFQELLREEIVLVGAQSSKMEQRLVLLHLFLPAIPEPKLHCGQALINPVFEVCTTWFIHRDGGWLVVISVFSANFLLLFNGIGSPILSQ